MSKVAIAVQEFLKEMQWEWEELDKNRYRLMIPGKDAKWAWIVAWEEDDSSIGCHSIVPLRVPTKARPAVAEYLTRANFGLRLGNFEMDYSDGAVYFKTSAPTKSIEPDKEFIKTLASAGFWSMDRYLPGLMGVAFGKINPAEAVQEADKDRRDEASPEDAGSGGDGRAADADGPTEGLEQASAPRRVRLRLSPPRQRKRRIAQFARLLRMMGRRAHKGAKCHCFMVIASQKHDGGDAPSSKAEEPRRMVQFCFHEDWFAIDVPNTVIEPAAAERVLGERRGFFRQADRDGDLITPNTKDLKEFDPIGKKYIYGDEREAAEDAAFVFFTAGNVAVNGTLYVTASAFGDGPHWETDEALA
jgi:hypothetical protein